jgi:RHS repeat-associated protein
MDYQSNYTYDYNSMLVSVYNDALAKTVTNTYGMGGATRIKKKDSQLGSRYYAYEGLNPLCEYDSTGAVKKKYVYAFGVCIAYVDSAGNKYWMHHDAIGSVKVITNSSGDSVATYKYYPFGDSLLTRGSAKNDMQFTGKPNIAGADLYDFNVRYYDPEIGRFYSIDPLWYPAESPYSYCYNNPVNYTDPTGMDMSKEEEAYLEKLKQDIQRFFEESKVTSISWNGFGHSGHLDKEFYYDWLESWRIYEILHGQPLIDRDMGRTPGIPDRLRSMVAAQGPHGNTNTRGTTPPPPGRPESAFGKVTGGTVNSGGSSQPPSKNYFTPQNNSSFYWDPGFLDYKSPTQAWFDALNASEGIMPAPWYADPIELIPIAVTLGATSALELEINVLSRGNVFKIVSRKKGFGFRIDPAHHGQPWGHCKPWTWEP